MKLHALVASAVTLALAFISPVRAEVNNADKMFIILTTGTVIQTTMCKDYDVVAGAPQKYADMNGADFDNLKGPVFAAIKAQIGDDYDRSELIPAVTRLVRGTFDEMASDFERNKPAACNKWGKLLLPSGLIRKK